MIYLRAITGDFLGRVLLALLILVCCSLAVRYGVRPDNEQLALVLDKFTRDAVYLAGLMLFPVWLHHLNKGKFPEGDDCSDSGDDFFDDNDRGG